MLAESLQGAPSCMKRSGGDQTGGMTHRKISPAFRFPQIAVCAFSSDNGYTKNKILVFSSYDYQSYAYFAGSIFELQVATLPYEATESNRIDREACTPNESFKQNWQGRRSYVRVCRLLGRILPLPAQTPYCCMRLLSWAYFATRREA